MFSLSSLFLIIAFVPYRNNLQNKVINDSGIHLMLTLMLLKYGVYHYVCCIYSNALQSTSIIEVNKVHEQIREQTTVVVNGGAMVQIDLKR